MPMIYKVREPRDHTYKPNYVTTFYASHPEARKHLLENPDATLEILEYTYKWQLVVMLNTAYDEGRGDATKRRAECS